MGIKGLLRLLAPIKETIHLSVFSNQRVGIDAFTWLHRAASCCAEELVLGRPTRKHLNYCFNLLKILLRFKIIPVFVFDGKVLPAKADTVAKRQRLRAVAKAAALRCSSKADRERHLRQAVEITSAIAHQFLQELKERDIECIVAPYEADAQLGFLSEIGDITAVFTVDSDLLLHGCQKVVYDFGSQSGECRMIRLERVRESGCILAPHLFSQEAFRLCCILAGCDYVDSVRGVGIMKAKQIIKRCVSGADIISQAVSILRAEFMEGKLKEAPNPDYENQVRGAEIALQYQWIYDTTREIVRRKREVPEIQEISQLEKFAGAEHPDPLVMKKICQGLLDAHTETPFELQLPSPLPTLLPTPIASDSENGAPKNPEHHRKRKLTMPNSSSQKNKMNKYLAPDPTKRPLVSHHTPIVSEPYRRPRQEKASFSLNSFSMTPDSPDHIDRLRTNPDPSNIARTSIEIDTFRLQV